MPPDRVHTAGAAMIGILRFAPGFPFYCIPPTTRCPVSQRKRTLLPGEKMSRTRQMRGGAKAERGKREEMCLARAPPPGGIDGYGWRAQRAHRYPPSQNSRFALSPDH